jgi:hypothetical protein
MTELFYRASEKDLAALHSVRVVFDDLADRGDVVMFERYIALLKQAQVEDVPRSAGPAALWRCNVVERPKQAPLLQYSLVGAMARGGDASFTLLEVTKSPSGGLVMSEEVNDIDSDTAIVLSSGRGDVRYKDVTLKIASLSRTLAAMKLGG